MNVKLSNIRSNSDQISKLSDRDRRELERIARRNHRTTATNVTTEFNQHLNSPFPTKNVRRELYKAGCQGRASTRSGPQQQKIGTRAGLRTSDIL